MSFDHLSSGCEAPGMMIHFGVDHPGPWWNGSFMENPALIGRAFPMLDGSW
jgi:hypothetical protein